MVVCLPSFWDGAGRYAELLAGLGLRFHLAGAEGLLAPGGRIHVIAHGYSAALALWVASANRPRTRSVVLYEPAMQGDASPLEHLRALGLPYLVVDGDPLKALGAICALFDRSAFGFPLAAVG